MVAKDYQLALTQKETLVRTFQTLGVPLEPSKLEGPETCLTFLGIEEDTAALQLRLPGDKLEKLKRQLKWANSVRRSIPKGELESLVGLLQFATKVVRPGRLFLRRLYALKNVGSQPDHLIRLNLPAKADILWWYIFVDSWNGISLLWDLGLQKPNIRVYSDASGSWDCGAFCQSRWFQLQWTPRLAPLSIAVKEMIPVVIAAALFGHHWSGEIVEFVVDNAAVVAVLKATYSSDLRTSNALNPGTSVPCSII